MTQFLPIYLYDFPIFVYTASIIIVYTLSNTCFVGYSNFA